MTARTPWAWTGTPADFDSGWTAPHVEYAPAPTPNPAPIAAGYASRDPARHPMRPLPQRPGETAEQRRQRELWYPTMQRKD